MAEKTPPRFIGESAPTLPANVKIVAGVGLVNGNVVGTVLAPADVERLGTGPIGVVPGFVKPPKPPEKE